MSGLELKRNSVIALYLEGKSNIEIRRALPKLQLNEKFVQRTIKRFSVTGSIKKRYGGGRRCTATAPANVEKVRHRLARNPERSIPRLAQDLNVSTGSIQTILKKKLKVQPLKENQSQELTALQRRKRMENFSQIMDPDYVNAIGEILAPATNNSVDSQENDELLATMPTDVNDSNNIPEEIFEEASSATTLAHPLSAEVENASDASASNAMDAVDSTETPQTESVSNETNVTDAAMDASASEPTASDESKNDGEKKDVDNGGNDAAEETLDDSASLIVPDEKTKRIDAVEEEINKNQCRICLSMVDLVDIYKFDDEKKLQICDLMTKLCPSLRIHERDYLPQFVCGVCEHRLNQAYELKLQCEATDRELRSKLPRRKQKSRGVTEFVMIDCNDLSSGSDDDDKDPDDDEFHLSEVVSSSSELDSEVSSEEEIVKRPPPKRARRLPPKPQPPPPPQKRQVIAPPPITNKAPPTTSKKVATATVANINVERIEADRKPVKRQQHFQCSICRKTFTDKTVFSSHVQKHREENERTCVQCRHKCATINELQKHMQSHHSKQRPAAPSNNAIAMKRRSDHDTTSVNGEQDLFKTVAPLTTTYWSDSFSD